VTKSRLVFYFFLNFRSLLFLLTGSSWGSFLRRFRDASVVSLRVSGSVRKNDLAIVFREFSYSEVKCFACLYLRTIFLNKTFRESETFDAVWQLQCSTSV